MAARRPSTVYLWELAWILPSIALPVSMLTAQIWSFAPNEIRVPAGSTVHFWATSKDLVHGLLVPRHNVNVMLLPGQISHAQARFNTPGEYPIICHEYCGVAHHTMAGKVIVEAKR